MWKAVNDDFEKIYSLVGSTINTVVYSVNVRVNFYSTEGDTFTMLLIQQIWTLKRFVDYVLMNEKFQIFASNYIR